MSFFHSFSLLEKDKAFFMWANPVDNIFKTCSSLQQICTLQNFSYLVKILSVFLFICCNNGVFIFLNTFFFLFFFLQEENNARLSPIKMQSKSQGRNAIKKSKLEWNGEWNLFSRKGKVNGSYYCVFILLYVTQCEDRELSLELTI